MLWIQCDNNNALWDRVDLSTNRPGLTRTNKNILRETKISQTLHGGLIILCRAVKRLTCTLTISSLIRVNFRWITVTGWKSVCRNSLIKNFFIFVNIEDDWCNGESDSNHRVTGWLPDPKSENTCFRDDLFFEFHWLQILACYSFKEKNSGKVKCQAFDNYPN